MVQDDRDRDDQDHAKKYQQFDLGLAQQRKVTVGQTELITMCIVCNSILFHSRGREGHNFQFSIGVT